MMHTELWENCTVASPLLTLPQCWNKIKAWHLFAKMSTLVCTKFLNMSRRKLFSHDLLFTLSAGCMRDGRLNGRYLPLDSQPRDGVSQVNVQGLSPGCSSDSCKRNQCSPPFTCVDLWRVHECRYKNSSSVNVPRLKSRKCFFCAKKKKIILNTMSAQLPWQTCVLFNMQRQHFTVTMVWSLTARRHSQHSICFFMNILKKCCWSSDSAHRRSSSFGVLAFQHYHLNCNTRENLP